MKAALIAIGNSRGIRIPASVIKDCKFGDTLEMRVEAGKLVLEAARTTRAGWDDAFARMTAAGDDTPLLADDGNTFDDTEWTW